MENARKLRVSVLASCTLLALLVASGIAGAQQVTLVRSADAGSLSPIDLQQTCSLGEAGEPGGVGPFPVTTRLTDGRLLVSYPINGGEILVFGPDCRYMRTVGRSGQGPGEFRFIRQLVSGANRIHVFDSRNRRRTVLTTELDVLRSSPFQGDPLGVAILNDSIMAYNSHIPTRDKAGLPLHILDRDASVIRSFGDSASTFRFDMGFPGWRRLARADGDSFWAARSTEYRIERWNSEGELLEVLRREVDWFPAHSEQPLPHPERPPVPFIAALQQDAQGRLWVLIAVPDEQWYEAVIEEATGRYNWTDDLNGFYDTTIEVLSPRDGRVLASRRVDRYMNQFMDRSHVASYRERDVDAVPVVDVWRLQLSSSPER